MAGPGPKLTKSGIVDRAGASPLFDDIPDPLDFSPNAEIAGQPPTLQLQPGPTRGALRRRRMLALGLLFGWYAMQLAFFGFRRDLGDLSPAFWLLWVALPIASAGVCYVAALTTGRLGLGLPRTSLLAIVSFGSLCLAVLALGLGTDWSKPTLRAINDAKCFALASLWSWVPSACAGWVLARTFAASSELRSALIGSACGLLAGATASLHCAAGEARHLLIGHAVPAMLSALLASLVLRYRTRV